jgi:ankyrin repeat protein
VNTELNGGVLPLHAALSTKAGPNVIALLLKYGADPQAKDALGRTPLMAAFESGQPREVARFAQLNQKHDLWTAIAVGDENGFYPN